MENTELIRLVAESDGVPSLAKLDAMITAAHALPSSVERDTTIDELLDFRVLLTSVEQDIAA